LSDVSDLEMSDTETIDTNYQPLVHVKFNYLVWCAVVMVNFQVHTQVTVR